MQSTIMAEWLSEEREVELIQVICASGKDTRQPATLNLIEIKEWSH